MKIFCNGDIICCDEKNSECRVLIEDKGKIIYLGDEIPEAYSQVKTKDLSGACLVPAFADTHIHFEALYLGGRKYTGQGKSATKLLARCAGEKIRSLIN